MVKRRRSPYAATKSRYLNPKQTVMETSKPKKIKLKSKSKSKHKSSPIRRSKLMRHLLEPLLPPLHETLLARARNRINRSMRKRSISVKGNSAVKGKNEPFIQQRIAKVVDASIGDCKPNTSVLVLIKDSSDTKSKSRRHKNAVRYAIECAQGDMEVNLNSYGNGEQKPKASRTAARRRAGTSKPKVGGKAAAKQMEIPLSNHLPIIDFISTAEFEKMYGNALEKKERIRS